MKVLRLISSHVESNTFVVFKGSQAVIVDSGATLEQVKNVVGDCNVVAVLLTHGHFDHVFNCLQYAKTFHCPIYINKNAKRALNDPALNYGENFSIKDLSNFVFLEGDGTIDLGEFKIDYFWTPGHSDCLNSYLIDGHLFVGDCIFKDGIGRMDLATSNKFQMVESLKKLEEVSFEVCHSGHYDDSDFARMNRNIQIYIKFLGRNN